MKTLREVGIGETAVVVKLHGEGAVKRRIMDMGITKNTSVFVRKVAPLGDPIEVTVRGYELSIRKADAQMIEVNCFLFVHSCQPLIFNLFSFIWIMVSNSGIRRKTSQSSE